MREKMKERMRERVREREREREREKDGRRKGGTGQNGKRERDHVFKGLIHRVVPGVVEVDL